MVGRQVWRAVVDVAISVCLLAETAPARGQEDTGEGIGNAPISVLGPKDPRLIHAVTLAVREASRRLDSPECRQVFSDFTDGTGADLETNLSALGETAKAYLRWIIFRNGSREAYCDRSNVTLATEPGSRFVTVCGVRFIELQREDPGYAASLVLHEELHVLGLEEDPPSSIEITRRVIARCGR
jgi:hypothetical protein